MRCLRNAPFKLRCFCSSLLQEGDEETAAKMQDLALAEGALPRHLHMAMFTKSVDKRLLMNRLGFLGY